MEVPQIRPDLCAKVRYFASSCQKCLSVCPVNAISIDNQSIEVTLDCIGCELCAVECPNDVFKAAGRIERGLGESEDLHCLYCSKLLSDERKDLANFPAGIFPCIGSVPVHFILNRISCNQIPLKIITMDCSQCEMKTGVPVFQNTKSSVMALLESAKINIEPVIVQEATPQDKIDAEELYQQFKIEQAEAEKFSRREFLTSFRSRLSPGKIPERSERGAANDPPTSKNKIPERLSSVIAFYRENHGNASNSDSSPLFSEVEIEESCTGCGACATVCPTAALSVEKEEKRVSLNWTPSHCTQCGLCTEVCSTDSIKFHPGVGIKKILDESSGPVKTFFRNVCLECNRDHMSYEITDDCPHCKKEVNIMEQFSKIIYRNNN